MMQAAHNEISAADCQEGWHLDLDKALMPFVVSKQQAIIFNTGEWSIQLFTAFSLIKLLTAHWQSDRVRLDKEQIYIVLL